MPHFCFRFTKPFLIFGITETENDMPTSLLQPFYGHSVCEAKINPAPTSIAMKLVTKVSPLAAQDTIMAPRVSAPALMCFRSIISFGPPTSSMYRGKRHAEYDRDPYSMILNEVLWKVPFQCKPYLCRNSVLAPCDQRTCRAPR